MTSDSDRRFNPQLFPIAKIAVPFIIGITAAYPHCPAPVTVFSAIALCALLCFLIWYHKKASSSPLILLTAFLLGFCHMKFYMSGRSVSLPDAPAEYEAVIISEPERHGKVMQFDMLVTTTSVSPVKVRASLLRDTISNRYLSLHAGSGIRATSLLLHPDTETTGSGGYSSWLQAHGYQAVTFIYYKSWQPAAVDMTSMSMLQRARLRLALTRSKLIEHINTTGLHGDQLSLISAMLLGDKSGLSKQLRQDYSDSGVSHLLALSGLHLSIIYFMLTLLFPRRRMKFVSQLTILSAVWIYVLLVGASASVVRAATMLTIYSLVSVMGNGRQSLNTLAAAAVIILAVNPLSLWDVGFELSFLAVTGILVCYHTIYKLPDYACTLLFGRKPSFRFPGSRLLRCPVSYIWSTVCVSASAQIATFPMILHYFGTFSTYSLLTNIVAVPLATVILYTAVIIMLATLTGLFHAWMGIPLSTLTGWLNSFVGWMASLPAASISTGRISAAATLSVYLLITALCIAIGGIRKPTAKNRQEQK